MRRYRDLGICIGLTFQNFFGRRFAPGPRLRLGQKGKAKSTKEIHSRTHRKPLLMTQSKSDPERYADRTHCASFQDDAPFH